MDQRIAEWEARTGKEWWEVLGMYCDTCSCCRDDGLCSAPCMVDGCFTAYEASRNNKCKGEM